jgi:hypothetical protein
MVLFLQSCIKDNYDTPPAVQDPNLKANLTIRDLKNMYTSSGQTLMTITGDYIISAIVTADDKSSNFYKEMVVQDSTAAIGIKIDQSSFYGDYPVGRRIFIKCKGMVVGNYNNLIQLGGYVDSVSTPGTRALGYVIGNQIASNLIKGSLGHFLTPEVVSISNLNDDYQYKLIKLNDVEFDCSNMGYTYADAVNQVDASRNLNDCSGNTIIVRTSGYSKFASAAVPFNKGAMTAIYTVYRTTPQLKLRDTSDVVFTNTTRCKTCVSGPTGNEQLITIAALRALYPGAATTITGKKIRGVVISDMSGGNIVSQNFVMQDATGGILCRLASGSQIYAVGDSVEVYINGLSLEDYKGTLQLNGLLTVSSAKKGTAVPSVRVVTNILDINNNFEKWESTLVKVQNVTIGGTPTTYSGSKTISDASSNMTLYTATTASFAASNCKTGSVTITGILSNYNTTNQIQMRTVNDVQ